MFSKLSVHAWSWCEGLNKEHSISVHGGSQHAPDNFLSMEDAKPSTSDLKSWESKDYSNRWEFSLQRVHQHICNEKHKIRGKGELTKIIPAMFCMPLPDCRRASTPTKGAVLYVAGSVIRYASLWSMKSSFWSGPPTTAPTRRFGLGVWMLYQFA